MDSRRPYKVAWRATLGPRALSLTQRHRASKYRQNTAVNPGSFVDRTVTLKQTKSQNLIPVPEPSKAITILQA